MGNNLFKATTGILAIAVVGIAIWANQRIGALESRGTTTAPVKNEDSVKLTECERTARDLRDEITGLKEQVAKGAQCPDGGAPAGMTTAALDIEQAKHDPGSVGPGTPISQDEVSKVVKGNRASIQACYERALKRNQDLHMQTLRLTLNFSIQPTGGVSAINIAPSVDSSLAECMQKTVSRWKFPKFTGAAIAISTPMNLKPRAN